MEQRLAYLDGLRGVAIALVVLYHAYARWPQLIVDAEPNGLSQGKMGVQLFFLVSGFVIFMSLERSRSLGDFLWRRWLRLFPAMLAASLFIYATATPLGRPSGQPSLRDLLPGLTFIAPGAWEALLGSPQGVLEGSFWSLFVQVKFYLAVAIVYFLLGPAAAIGVLAATFLLPYVVGRFFAAEPIDQAASLLDSGYWGWFAAGALYCRFAVTGRRWLFFAALGLSLYAARRTQAFFVPGAVCMALLFAAAQVNDTLRALLASRPLVFLGVVSYPLYLLHEDTTFALTLIVRDLAPWLPKVLAPILPIAIVVALAWVLARWIEPALRARLERLVRRKAETLAPNAPTN